jgi:hypothetical protein
MDRSLKVSNNLQSLKVYFYCLIYIFFVSPSISTLSPADVNKICWLRVSLFEENEIRESKKFLPTDSNQPLFMFKS